MNNNTLALFDIDGTLLTMWPVHEKVYASTIEEVYGVAGVNFRRFYRPGDTNSQIVKMNLEHLGYDAEFIEQGLGRIPEAMGKYYEKYVRTDEITILPGVAALLKALKEDNTNMGVVTGSNLRNSSRILEKAKLIGYFPVMATADDGDSRELRLLSAIKRSESMSGLKFDAGRIFYLDDSDHSVPSSRKLGVVSIAVATGEVSYAQLKAVNPDYTFRSLENTPSIMRVLRSDSSQVKSRSR